MDLDSLRTVMLATQAGLLLAAVLIAGYLWARLRMQVAVPEALLEDFTDSVDKREFREAYELARGGSSFLAQVLLAGLQQVQYGIGPAVKAAEKKADAVQARYKAAINYLPALATIWTMAGVVADQGANGPVVGASALLGLVMAVPSVLGHVMFSNRLVAINHRVREQADHLLNRLDRMTARMKEQS